MPIRPIGIAIACLLIAQTACFANERASQVIQWHCVQRFDEAFNAQCHVTLPAESTSSAASAAPTPVLSSNPATQSRYQPVAMRPRAQLREQDPWFVPLFTVPSSPENAGVLLRAVLCGRSDTCIVHYEIGHRVLSEQPRNPFIR